MSGSDSEAERPLPSFPASLYLPPPTPTVASSPSVASAQLSGPHHPVRTRITVLQRVSRQQQPPFDPVYPRADAFRCALQPVDDEGEGTVAWSLTSDGCATFCVDWGATPVVVGAEYEAPDVEWTYERDGSLHVHLTPPLTDVSAPEHLIVRAMVAADPMVAPVLARLWMQLRELTVDVLNRLARRQLDARSRKRGGEGRLREGSRDAPRTAATRQASRRVRTGCRRVTQYSY